jgi:hypothetical protein
MFVLKSTHEKLIQAEKQRCADIVSQMSEQIADLRKLVFVPTPSHLETLPVRQANAILDGVEVMPRADQKAEEQALAEANRILSGDYDRFEEEVF